MDCPLCYITNKEKVIYSEPLLYLVETKSLKGHKIRVMVATARHTMSPTFEELSCAYYVIIKYMNWRMKSKKWMMFDSTYCSVSDHWHLIAADIYSSDPIEVAKMRKTPRVTFPR